MQLQKPRIAAGLKRIGPTSFRCSGVNRSSSASAQHLVHFRRHVQEVQLCANHISSGTLWSVPSEMSFAIQVQAFLWVSSAHIMHMQLHQHQQADDSKSLGGRHN